MTRTPRVRRTRVSLPRSVRRLFPQVNEAVDAAEAVEVSVEPKDCKEATKLNPAECALARAAKRELDADGVIIGISTSYIIKGKTAVRFATPESVRRELVSFDRHQDFAPGDYYLTPKSPTGRFGEPHGEKLNGSHAPKRKVHHSARVRVLATGTSR